MAAAPKTSGAEEQRELTTCEGPEEPIRSR